MIPRLDPDRMQQLLDAVAGLPAGARGPYLDQHCPDPELRRRVEFLVAKEELFHAGVDLPPEEQGPYLDEHCPNPELRRQVEALLAAHASLGQQSSPAGASAEASLRPEDETPPNLDGLVVLARIAAGGMGVVWRVRDPHFQRPLAVKVMKAGLRDNPNAVRRFLAEARITGQLAHPSVVPVHAQGKLPDGRPYYTMKLVEGDTLADLLRGPAPRRMELVQVFAQVCQALAFAHSRGVIHRDLKPANVMVGAHGEVQVMDWGVAKVLADGEAPPAEPGGAHQAGGAATDETQDRTRTGSALGTWAYMPPEQACGLVADVDRQSDVFGLGAILCVVLTGEPPYTGAGPGSVKLQAKEARLDGAVARLRGCGADAELIQLAERCLAAKKADRPADAGQVAAAVAHYQTAVQERLQQAQMERERQQVKTAEERRRRKLWVGLAAAVLAALGVSIWGLVLLRQANLELRNVATRSQREAALSTWDRGRTLCEEGEVSHGLLVIAQALEAVPPGPEDVSLREALRLELAAWHRHCHTLCQLWEHPKEVLAVAASPDGKTVVTGCADGKVRLWDLNSTEDRCVRAGHDGGVFAVGFSGDGNTFITGGADGKVYLWDAATTQQIGPLEGGHPGGVWAVALSRDGKLALTGGADTKARLWDLPARTCRTTLKHDGAVLTVAFRLDGDTFVTGGKKQLENENEPRGEVRLYETRAAHDGKTVLQEKQLDRVFRKPIRSVAFSPDGETLLIGDDDWEATFWDVGSGKLFASAAVLNGNVRGVAFAPDSNTALTGAQESGLAHLWDVQVMRNQWIEVMQTRIKVEDPGRRPLHTSLPHPSPITAVTFVGGDGQHFLTACEDKYVRVWRKAIGQSQSIRVLPHSPKPANPVDRSYALTAVAFHPDGKFVATAGRNGEVNLWNVATGERAGARLQHPPEVRPVAFLPDGQIVVTGGKDGKVRFWDLGTRTESKPPLDLPGEVGWVSVSRDGSLILTSCAGGTAQLWNANSRAKLGEQLSHEGRREIWATAISPDNKRLLTGGADGMVYLWGEDGKQPRELRHQNEVREVNFNHDGTLVVTASDDGTVRIWEAATGKLQTTLTHTEPRFTRPH